MGPPLSEMGEYEYSRNELKIFVEDTATMWPLNLTWDDLFHMLDVVRWCGFGKGVWLEMSAVVMVGERGVGIVKIKLARGLDPLNSSDRNTMEL